MSFPILPKRKADTLSNGVFLIFLGIIIYTGRWWPDILFALGTSFAIRQYLTNRKTSFFITVALIGLLGLITLAGHTFSILFPLLFIAAGLFLIGKECFGFKNLSHHSSSEKR